MFKCTKKGIVIEVWPPIVLTEEDLETIAEEINIRTGLPESQKVNGKWIQRIPTSAMDSGYRVFGEDNIAEELTNNKK